MTREEILSRAKPILFNTEMVKAILDGRKTVTRRPVKMKYGNTHIEIRNNKYGSSIIEKQNDVEGETFGKRQDGTLWQKVLAIREVNPPYKVGDYLYVRETFNKDPVRYLYKANYSDNEIFYRGGIEISMKWCPSIHMPKEAARIFLRVKNMRVERLQDIDGYGIFLEGVDNGKSNPTMGNRWENMQKIAYSELWDSIVKKSDLDKYGWDANPWVWVIEFERVIV